MSFNFYDSEANVIPIFTANATIPTASAVTATFFFFTRINYQFTVPVPPVNSLVEIKEESEVSWTNLNTGDYDMTPHGGGKKTFQLRMTPDAPRVVSVEIFELRAEPI